MRLQRQTNKKPQVVHQNSVECSCVLPIGVMKTLFEINYLLLSGQSKVNNKLYPSNHKASRP